MAEMKLNLTYHLKRLNMNYTELAKLLGRTPQYVSLLNRKKALDYDTMLKLKEIFGLDSLDELFIVYEVTERKTY